MTSLSIMHLACLMGEYNDLRSVVAWLFLLGREPDNVTLIVGRPDCENQIGLSPCGSLEFYVSYPGYSSGLSQFDAAVLTPSGNIVRVRPPRSIEFIIKRIASEFQPGEVVAHGNGFATTINGDLAKRCLRDDGFDLQGRIQSVGVHVLRFQAGQDQTTVAVFAGTYAPPHLSSRHYCCAKTTQLVNQLARGTEALSDLAQQELDGKNLRAPIARDWLAARPTEQANSHVGSRVALSDEATADLTKTCKALLSSKRVLGAAELPALHAASRFVPLELGRRQKVDAEQSVLSSPKFVRLILGDKSVGNRGIDGSRRTLDVPADNWRHPLITRIATEVATDQSMSAREVLETFGFNAPGNSLRHRNRSKQFENSCPGHATNATLSHAGYGNSDQDYYATGIRRERNCIALDHLDTDS